MTLDEAGHPHPGADRPSLLQSLVRLNRYALLLLLIPAGVIYFWPGPEWKKQEAAKQTLHDLTTQRDGLVHKVEKLEKKLELIKNDPEYLETMARDRLSLQKDGEIILHFEE
jgi:cell division protein FtsB